MKAKVGLLLALLSICALALSGLDPVASAGPKMPDASAPAPLVRYVSERVPVQGASVEKAAMRPMLPPGSQSASTTSNAPASIPVSNSWQLLSTLPGAVVKDLSFPTPLIGYAAAELGQVWKTVDGGNHWTRILNQGFPYYWYGIHALDANTVAITGFINNNSHGVLRWSTDGGTTWGPDQLLNPSGWSYRVRFADPLHGLVVEGTEPNQAHYTTDGGVTASDWMSVTMDTSPSAGWFGNQFSLLPSLRADASGITYCTSPNGGATWGCHASVDSTFDGATFFANDQAGWVGGGSISPTVEGWAHRTTDGGTTWSGRTLTSPWPVREFRFLDDQVGWAAGGNLYADVGGMYFTTDGGQTWSPDIETGFEMDACDTQPLNGGHQVWCVGYTGSGSFSSRVYGLLYEATVTPSPTAETTPSVTITSTPTATAISTSTSLPSATSTAEDTATVTVIPSTTPTSTPTQPVATYTVLTATPTACTLQFIDVPADSTFYPYIHCLACLGIVSGYPDNTFRPANDVSRGQLSKIISNSAGLDDAQPDQLFEDVPVGSTFQVYVGRLASRGFISGYPCGGTGEPCGAGNLPYFRPNSNASRGQITKIDANAAGYSDTPTGQQFEDVLPGSTFYTYTFELVSRGIMAGYPCGGAGEPCGTGNLPYFRPNSNASRGQTSKIVSNTFFPDCAAQP